MIEMSSPLIQVQSSLATSLILVVLGHRTREVANTTRIGQGQMKVCFLTSTSMLVYISIKALNDQCLSDSSAGCLEDTQSSLAPNYMKKTGAFLYTALDECCERHYSHRVNECKGLSSAGSDKYVVDWSTFKCVKDCDVADGADCGGLADGFWDLIHSYTTKEECCRTRVGWDINGCMA